MADGRYTSRRPTAHEYGKLGANTQPWETTNSRLENGRAKPRFTIHQPNFNSSAGKNEPAMDGPRQATVTAPSRPARFNWATSPTYESSISRPTSDIGAVVDYVKESIKMPAVAAGPQKGQFSSPPPQLAKEKMIETIDSKEAARRYGGLELLPPRQVTSGTINSREAARKYKGALFENQPVSSV